MDTSGEKIGLFLQLSSSDRTKTKFILVTKELLLF